jgi:Zn-dependent M28 family amino/carboxypeptidase
MRYTLAGETGASPLRIEGWLRAAHARRLFDAAGLRFDELLVRAARRDFVPQPTGLALSARIAGSRRAIDTQNVIGVIAGQQQRAEGVVFTAHYDHLGVGPAAGSDSIYNGAYDNASGVAAVLEIARAFKRLEEPLPRSVVFLFTTAEEAGLLGATAYVRSPQSRIERTVAAINLDGANLWGETEDYIALGGERSTLGRDAEARAAELGMVPAPDPAPQAGLFYRSDHFPFVLAGVPAVQIMHGERYRGRAEDWGAEMLAQWNARSYHQPGDEYDPGFDLRGAVQQARLAFLVGYDAARGDSAPRWLEGGLPGLPGDVRGRSGNR